MAVKTSCCFFTLLLVFQRKCLGWFYFCWFCWKYPSQFQPNHGRFLQPKCTFWCLLIYFLTYGWSVGLGLIPRQKLIKNLEILILFAWDHLRKQDNKIQLCGALCPWREEINNYSLNWAIAGQYCSNCGIGSCLSPACIQKANSIHICKEVACTPTVKQVAHSENHQLAKPANTAVPENGGDGSTSGKSESPSRILHRFGH